MKSVIEQILDENNNNNIKIKGNNGEIFTFEQIALINLEDDTYTILHPIADDVSEDDVLVFKILFNENEASLELEEDEQVIEDCFNQYYTLLKNRKK